MALIGTPLLRAYMHGYFVDVRLYKKAQTLARPVETSVSKKFVEERVRKEMTEILKRVETKKKPKVNSELFERLQIEENEDEAEEPRKRSKKKKAREAMAASLLKDERFKGMFEDENFEIDTEEDAFRLINPVVAKMKEAKAAKNKKTTESDEDSESGDEEVVDPSLNERDEGSESDSVYDSDGDEALVEKQVSVPRKQKKKQKGESTKPIVSLKEVADIQSSKRSKKDRMSLGSRLDRLQEDESSRVLKRHAEGSHSMTFRKSRNKKEMMLKKKNEEHMEERRKVGRSARALKNRKPYRS